MSVRVGWARHTGMGLTIERRMWMVDHDALNGLWMREQALLGLDRITSDEEFARGGLGAFAADPTVRIAVLPGDPSSQPVPAEKPEAVIPKTMTVGGRQLAYHGIVRGTSSGYVGYTIGNEGRCRAGAGGGLRGPPRPRPEPGSAGHRQRDDADDRAAERGDRPGRAGQRPGEPTGP